MGNASLKRGFDLIGATAGLVVFAPAMALVAIAILLDDGRPVLFRQPRLGFGRRPFSILKFRSMRDGRKTRVGSIVRKTGLDEIPQFVNILRGEMSAVGPRPLTAEDVLRLGWTTPAHDFRWSCRPGLTGLAQLVAGQSPDDALELDRAYVARWRPLLDCRLIAWSFVVNVAGKARVQARLRKSALAKPLS